MKVLICMCVGVYRSTANKEVGRAMAEEKRYCLVRDH